MKKKLKKRNRPGRRTRSGKSCISRIHHFLRPTFGYYYSDPQSTFTWGLMTDVSQIKKHVHFSISPLPCESKIFTHPHLHSANDNSVAPLEKQSDHALHKVFHQLWTFADHSHLMWENQRQFRKRKSKQPVGTGGGASVAKGSFTSRTASSLLF